MSLLGWAQFVVDIVFGIALLNHIVRDIGNLPR